MDISWWPCFVILLMLPSRVLWVWYCPVFGCNVSTNVTLTCHWWHLHQPAAQRSAAAVVSAGLVVHAASCSAKKIIKKNDRSPDNNIINLHSVNKLNQTVNIVTYVMYCTVNTINQPQVFFLTLLSWGDVALPQVLCVQMVKVITNTSNN